MVSYDVLLLWLAKICLSSRIKRRLLQVFDDIIIFQVDSNGVTCRVAQVADELLRELREARFEHATQKNRWHNSKSKNNALPLRYKTI